MTPLERFSANYIPVTESGCWLWTGYVDSYGYGRISVNGRAMLAHRYSYECHKKPIPLGLQIDHLCRVRCCVNPEHLEVVTNTVNVLRGVGITARNARKTHCKRGHEFTEENTLIMRWPRGRSCKICLALWWANNADSVKQYRQAYYQENKETMGKRNLAYYWANRDSIRQYQKEQYQKRKRRTPCKT
jgi:hypothetical protein